MQNISLRHLVRVDDVATEDVYLLIQRALELKKGAEIQDYKQKVFASNLFFENSTRTHCSFAMAQQKLGMSIIPFEVSTSSINKGESLYDTVLTLDALGVDIMVIRHPLEAFYQTLINQASLKCSIINGGDGTGEHPTQSLLDVMTIYEQFQDFKELKVVIVGDLKHSRVAHSNARLLKRLGSKLFFCSPDAWWDESLSNEGERTTLDECINEMDVVMLLRVQHERHNDLGFDQTEYHAKFGLNETRYAQLNEKAIVMHPAPVNRGSEIVDVCVEAEKSRIVEQMRNGVYMRMAILEAIMQERTQSK